MNINDEHIVFFDVDNTIIKGYSLKYFIKYLSNEKIISKNKLLLTYIWFILYKLRIIRKVNYSFKFLFKFLKGWQVDKFDIIVNDFFNRNIKDIIFKDSANKINEHLNLGHKIILVSTSIYPIVNIIAKNFGIQDILATKLEIINNRYTGGIEGNVLEGNNKLKEIKYYLNNINNKKIITYFYTDHYSDVDVLNFVDKPFVVNPDKFFLNFSKNKGWEILNFN